MIAYQYGTKALRFLKAILHKTVSDLNDEN